MHSSPRHSAVTSGNQPTTASDTIIGDEGTGLEILPGGELVLRNFELGESHPIGRFRDAAEAWAALDELDELEGVTDDNAEGR